MRQKHVDTEIPEFLDSAASSRFLTATTFWGGLLLSGFMLAAAVILAS